jgi:5-methylthioadenosine/S-adenosylhomocysteine deaminase
MTAQDVYNGARLAIAEMLKSGTTTFAEMYFEEGAILSAVSESGIRARVGFGMSNANKSRDESEAELTKANEFVANVREVFAPRVKPMLAPHATYTCDDWFLKRISELAKKVECPLHTHLSETEDTVKKTLIQHGVRPVEHLDELGFWEPSTYVAHAIHLDETEINTLGKNDVGVAHCPGANMKLRSGACPVTNLREAGVQVSIATDGAASNNNLDLLEESKLAALVARNRTTNPVIREQTVLEMATLVGAELLNFKTGRIEPGFHADLVVLNHDIPAFVPSHDPVSNIVYSVNRESVETVLVGGDILVRNEELLVFDEADVYDAARKSSQRLQQ